MLLLPDIWWVLDFLIEFKICKHVLKMFGVFILKSKLWQSRRLQIAVGSLSTKMGFSKQVSCACFRCCRVERLSDSLVSNSWSQGGLSAVLCGAPSNTVLKGDTGQRHRTFVPRLTSVCGNSIARC